jgi:hypothetical protein
VRLNVKALVITFGIVWGGAVFLTAVMNLIWAGYGQPLLSMMASVYPGYHATRNLVGVLVGTGYALVDGFVCGAIVGWLYNRLTPSAS